jgi:hypothetical protein
MHSTGAAPAHAERERASRTSGESERYCNLCLGFSPHFTEGCSISGWLSLGMSLPGMVSTRDQSICCNTPLKTQWSSVFDMKMIIHGEWAKTLLSSRIFAIVK